MWVVEMVDLQKYKSTEKSKRNVQGNMHGSKETLKNKI